MARRYIPDKPATGRFHWHGLLLFILPLPLLLSALLALLNNNLKTGIGSGLGFILAMLAASLARKGIGIEKRAQKLGLRRRSSTLPYKLIAAILLGLSVATTSRLAIDNGWLVSLLLGIATITGFYLYYGFDALRSSDGTASVGITSEEVLQLLEEAEVRIQGIERARAGINNQELRERLQRIITQTRYILQTIEQDPHDARRARKFLKVYLDGAQQVTRGYAQTHVNVNDDALDEKFRRVLETIENVISEQQKKLLQNNASELDVQIEVLQMQLEQEGIV